MNDLRCLIFQCMFIIEQIKKLIIGKIVQFMFVWVKLLFFFELMFLQCKMQMDYFFINICLFMCVNLCQLMVVGCYGDFMDYVVKVVVQECNINIGNVRIQYYNMVENNVQDIIRCFVIVMQEYVQVNNCFCNYLCLWLFFFIDNQ